MDAVAAEAGVGKGTLFRRFGDRASLARAVVSEYETKLQDEHDPRRGAARPGRAAARAPARVRARLRRIPRTATASCCARPRARYEATSAARPYAFYRTHVALLLREGGLGDRSDFLADVVLAPLAATVFSYLRGTRGGSLRRAGRTLTRTSARGS